MIAEICIYLAGTGTGMLIVILLSARRSDRAARAREERPRFHYGIIATGDRRQLSRARIRARLDQQIAEAVDESFDPDHGGARQR